LYTAPPIVIGGAGAAAPVPGEPHAPTFSSHATEPSSCVVTPAAHLVQLVPPMAVAKVPTMHGRHSVCAERRVYHPCPHIVHAMV
jgi:hypothetical protein